MEHWFNSSSSTPRASKGTSGRNLGQTTVVQTTAALQTSTNAPASALRRNAHQTSHQSLPISPISNPASASGSTVSTSNSSKPTIPPTTKKNQYISEPY